MKTFTIRRETAVGISQREHSHIGVRRRDSPEKQTEQYTCAAELFRLKAQRQQMRSLGVVVLFVLFVLISALSKAQLSIFIVRFHYHFHIGPHFLFSSCSLSIAPRPMI
jgi:NADH:ubiquinone oxidoreductase subunit 3 (subunit A)